MKQIAVTEREAKALVSALRKVLIRVYKSPWESDRQLLTVEEVITAGAILVLLLDGGE